MSDVEFQNDATNAFDTTRFASSIRKSLRQLVEDVVTKVPGNVDARQSLRAAGERLGVALAAHAGVSSHPRSGRALDAHVDVEVVTIVDDPDGRARAFRVMAGVRL